MKIRKISVTVAKTIQTAPYEPSVVSVTYEGELEDGDSVSECREKLHKLATSGVTRGLQVEKEKYSAKPKFKKE